MCQKTLQRQEATQRTGCWPISGTCSLSPEPLQVEELQALLLQQQRAREEVDAAVQTQTPPLVAETTPPLADIPALAQAAPRPVTESGAVVHVESR